MDYPEILKELANPIRMSILLVLNDAPNTIGDLKATIGDISHSEISRHVGRLAKQDLITKEAIPGRNYELTEFGKIVVKFLKPLDFVVKNGGYFTSHLINPLPDIFLNGLSALNSSELIIGTGKLLSKGKDFIESANKELWVITDEPFPYEITAKDVYLIIPPKMLKHGLDVDHEKTRYHVHVLPEVKLCLTISDVGQGFLFFPRADNQRPDFNSGFYILGPPGIDYLRRIFDHFWQSSKEFLFDPNKF